MGVMKIAAVPVLMYHGLANVTSPVSVTTDQFAQHMAVLKRIGASVRPLAELVDHIKNERPLPPKTVAITFDDGLQSVYDCAWPVLRQFGFPATVFAVAGHVGRDSGWPGQPPGIHREPTMSWAQLRELQRNGIAIGSHSLDHPRLDQLTEPEIRRQVIDARQLTEAELGAAPRLFAYPYGRHSALARQVVSRECDAAFTARPGRVKFGSDPWRLDRIDICYISQPWLIARLLDPVLGPYLALRRTARTAASRILRRAWV